MLDSPEAVYETTSGLGAEFRLGVVRHRSPRCECEHEEGTACTDERQDVGGQAKLVEQQRQCGAQPLAAHEQWLGPGAAKMRPSRCPIAAHEQHVAEIYSGVAWE